MSHTLASKKAYVRPTALKASSPRGGIAGPVQHVPHLFNAVQSRSKHPGHQSPQFGDPGLGRCTLAEDKPLAYVPCMFQRLRKAAPSPGPWMLRRVMGSLCKCVVSPREHLRKSPQVPLRCHHVDTQTVEWHALGIASSVFAVAATYRMGRHQLGWHSIATRLCVACQHIRGPEIILSGISTPAQGREPSPSRGCR